MVVKGVIGVKGRGRVRAVMWVVGVEWEPEIFLLNEEGSIERMIRARGTAACAVHGITIRCGGRRWYGWMGGVGTAPACAWVAHLVSGSHGGMYSGEVAHHAFVLLLLVGMDSLRVLTEVI